MAMPIIPRPVRGRLYFRGADVLLPTFAGLPGAKVRQLDLTHLSRGGQ